MIICPKCGAQNEGAVCVRCGTPLAAFGDPPAKKKHSLVPWIIILSILVIALGGLIVYLVMSGGKDSQKSQDASNPSETIPVETEPVSNAPRFSSGWCKIDDKIFMCDESGICYFRDGIRKDIYPAYNWNFVTDGNSVILSLENNSIIKVDVETGSIETLFRLNVYGSAVLGATDQKIFIGTMETEDDWFGYTVSAYDYSGTKLKTYNTNYYGEMKDGIMMLSDFRTDVSPMECYVFDAVTDKLLYQTDPDTLSWGVSYVNGNLYSIEVPADTYDVAYAVKFRRVNPDGTMSDLRVFDVQKGAYSYSYAFYLDGALACISNYENGYTRYFNLETNEELIAPFESSIELDYEGIPYCVVDKNVYRQNADGKYNLCCTISGWESYVSFVSGDYVYFVNDGVYDSTYGPIK